MQIKIFCFIALLAITGLVVCKEKVNSTAKTIQYEKGSYGYDIDFLKSRIAKIIELKDATGSSRVLLSPHYQGRVMTSTALGDSGTSFGWINYDLIASGKWQQQFNPVGGEERFWIGPEGGQYSFYFKQGDSMNIRNWQVPGIIDTSTFDVVQSGNTSATFSKKATVSNYSGTIFQFEITRQINLLNRESIEQKIKAIIPANIKYVGYESNNQIRNTGNKNWKKERGLISIWLLGMMTPSDRTVVIIPFVPIHQARSFITDDYFGKIPSSRLVLEDSVLFFTCDGKYRSKIGLSPRIAKPLAASFDFNKNVLTMIYFDIDRKGLYVNSKWEMQKDPYSGDVLNSYNDGPLETGSQLGPFYELESSSGVKELGPGERQEYKQATCHFQGDYVSMKEFVVHCLRIDLDHVRSILPNN